MDAHEGCAGVFAVVVLEPLNGQLEIDQSLVPVVFTVEAVVIVKARYGQFPPDEYAVLNSIVELRHKVTLGPHAALIALFFEADEGETAGTD
jgi:hypothetical protein